VLDPNFGHQVKAYASKQTQAAAMEHAARHFIRSHLDEDPVYYKKLSEKLETLLQQYKAHWDALAEALEVFVREMQAGRPADTTGLDPRTQAPFYSLLLEAQPTPPDETRQRVLATATVRMVDGLRQRTRVVDFWRNPVKRQGVRGWLVTYLDDHDLIPFSQCEKTADDLMHLARSLHTRLTDPDGLSSAMT
jgi:type I restriction enzyme, R subunit